MTVPKRVGTRISRELRRYKEILQAAHDRDVNESDTVVIIMDFLSDVLGFKKYQEITTEFAIHGTYCDLAIKMGKEIAYLVEAKAIGIPLKERHLRQAVGYAATHGVNWVILTNGVHWMVYRMLFEQPVKSDLVFTLNLLETSHKDGEAIERLFLLSREGLKKAAIEEFREKRAACNPFRIGAVIMSDPVIATVRRELRRISPGAKIDEDEIREILAEEVLKREVVEGDEAKAASSRVKRAASRRLRARKQRRQTKREPGGSLPMAKGRSEGS